MSIYYNFMVVKICKYDINLFEENCVFDLEFQSITSKVLVYL